MRELEERFARELTVVGVHSGKFITERETARVAEAAKRLGVEHPVVNDRQFRVWRSYAVRAWPTIVVIDPRGYVLGMHAGEFTTEMIADALEPLIANAGEALVRGSPHEMAPEPARSRESLRYPGKVALDGDRLAIADSGNHRVIVATLESTTRARVTRVVGSKRGFRDGAEGLFDTPQGLCFDGDTLFVADAENHALRAIDLRSGDVRTVAGTGSQLRTRADMAAGALSSPWDVALRGDELVIAMSGNHRLYTARKDGGSRPFAGSGAEDIADGPLLEAPLAQPMGIAVSGDRVWFADAESSAIRWADDREVGTVVGTGLFDFGDADGSGDAVRLQHAQGLAVHPDGRLLVADSYNDALKWIDPATRTATTWLRGFDEPGGVAIGDGAVYVADTNTHRIVIADVATGSIAALELIWR